MKKSTRSKSMGISPSGNSSHRKSKTSGSNSLDRSRKGFSGSGSVSFSSGLGSGVSFSGSEGRESSSGAPVEECSSSGSVPADSSGDGAASLSVSVGSVLSSDPASISASTAERLASSFSAANAVIVPRGTQAATNTKTKSSAMSCLNVFTCCPPYFSGYKKCPPMDYHQRAGRERDCAISYIVITSCKRKSHLIS